MKIKEILQESIKQLKANEVEEPHAKARRLLAFTLSISKVNFTFSYSFPSFLYTAICVCIFKPFHINNPFVFLFA